MAEHIEKILGEGKQPPPLAPRARSRKFPLSFAQQRLWFLDQLEPGTATYNVPRAFQIRGALRVEVLRRALAAIVDRHESLRTIFVRTDEGPVQVIAERGEVPIVVVDLRELSPADREAKKLHLLAEEARRPFDLARGPLIRALVLQSGQAEHILMLTMHHIVSDGWSMSVLYEELAALYAAFSQGQSSPLAKLPIQYVDFAQWQRDSLQGEVLEQHLSYWKKQLGGIPALQLPTDRPRLAVHSSRGARQSIVLSKELTDEVKALSRREGATLFMTLLTAFNVLLYRYTGQEDIVVGTPIAGRNRVEIERLIGSFVNTLVLRTAVSGDLTFGELLDRVRDLALEAFTHQDLPFERLVEELQPERSLGHAPLFQVMFTFQNYPNVPLEMSGSTVSPLDVYSETAKVDLTLQIKDESPGLQCLFEYSTDLFDTGTITRMLGHFQTLLKGIVADPARLIGKLPLVTEAERRQLTVEWNNTKRDYPKGKCIPGLFEERARRSPQAVAVVHNDQQLTYDQLNRRANQLAHYLNRQGVGAEILVAIYAERSLEMIVALLAVLKAGGAYVPLDPEYPKERLAHMLEDSHPLVILAQQKLLPQLPETIRGPTVICLDADWGSIAEESEDNPSGEIRPDTLAYVIYTSGSTGRPKGVTVEHSQLLNYSMDIIRKLNPGAGCSFAMVQPLTFDSSVTVLFSSLLTGGSLHVISRERAANPYALGEYFRRWPIDVFKITPSHFAALQTSLLPERFMPRRCLVIGGEESRLDWVQSLQAVARGCTIFNHYGPTETTVGVLMYRIQDGDGIANGSKTPLGRPIANTQVYLLDRNLQPVPVGVPGELHIAGRNLTRGYLNRPDLTAERFIPNPFGAEPDARMYKTGDLARYLPDGNIEFLGRGDDQVKIRGFRVELGEIESMLAQHASVREAVVLAREDSPGDKRLVAYVVPRRNGTLSPSALRGFLAEKLPDYMVPSAFVLLDFLPITPNGKIDRRGLPQPDTVRPDLRNRYVEPRHLTEKLLAEIWADVLRVDKIGIHDNFFDLGGHSLLATRVMSRVRSVFKVELPLRNVFEAPTVAGLSERIRSARGSEVEIVALPIMPEAIDGDYPLSFSQERFWFLSQLEPSNLAYRISYGFRLTGPLNVDALEQSLVEIVRRHETLRTTFPLRNGQPVQVIAEQWSFRLSILDLLQETAAGLDTEVQRLFESERGRPFDLSIDLLLRATLLRLGADEHVLFLNSHHIAWDHWCIELFFRELSILYRAFAAGQSSPLPELPIQYKHYALWQRRVFQGRELESHLAYWRQQLEDAPPSLDLPTDHPRKLLRNRRGGLESMLLPNGLSEELKILSRKTGVSLFMTFLAAFQTLLHRMTGRDDIVVGTPVAGRDRSETEGLIGLFLNSLALRTDLSGNPTFVDLLGRVREVALGAYDHQDLPFEKLVEELQPERDLTQTPIFQVFINLYNFKEAGLELEQLSVESIKASQRAPQFDIEFYIREHDDGIHLIFDYDSDLFDATTIATMLGYFHTLLQSIVSHPEQRISDLPILTDADKHQLLVEWNDTAEDYPRETCVHRLFEARVEKSPEAVAVVFEDRQLTYRELNHRANQLAHYLRRRGVRAGSLVGICMGRSLDMVIGLLGILKAAGAYVPLDPAYPKERLNSMLEDSKATLVVTQEQITHSLPEIGADVLCLDRHREGIEQESKENAPDGPDPDNLAYVLYTSGSTGLPKGVSVEHRQLANYVFAILDRLDLAEAGSFATVSTIAADLGNTVIFASLCTGGTLHVISQERVSDPARMAEYMTRHPIDYLKIVPSHLAALQTASCPGRVLPRKMLILGGEAANADWVKEVQSQAPDLTIVNHYGPTEATVGVLTYQVKPEFLSKDLCTLPLGRPLSNIEIYLLDRYMNPVPVGVPGELYIGGQNLTRGYWNRPELTAEKFLPNPFAKPGARWYKTGDLARYLANGDIEFLGRTDDQVKIRGYRIEPGEIESALRRHPAVRDAAVLAHENGDGQKQLTAYVVANRRQASAVTGKRRYQLPNGTAIAQLNKNETDYMYQEIFERQAYLRHGITIEDGDCIFDVGANIGLFMLFAHQTCKNPKVYSFEPNPAVFELLSANASLCGADVKLFNCGLSTETKSATFTFFPGFSLLSGFYADAEAEKEVVKAYMLNQQKTGVSEMGELLEQADDILKERFSFRTFTAQLRELSSVIEQEQIECIDLLKINVEKSELDVLRGIQDADWRKIKQIVLEVDVQESLPTILGLLAGHGFESRVEQDVLLKNTQLCYVYAVRPSKDRTPIKKRQGGTRNQSTPVLQETPLSVDALRSFLRQKLPEYMIPSAFVFLDALPLTPNGKVDRRALPSPDQTRPELESGFVTPCTPVEEAMARIWAEVLKVEKVGVHDNFFDLGGHSLLATQVISRVRANLKIELPLRSLFEFPNVAGLAEHIETVIWAAKSREATSGEREEMRL